MVSYVLKGDGNMFENSGSKIKVLAKVVFWIETIGCIITALSMFGLAADSYDGAFFVGIGFSILIAGPFAAWISALFIYAFGTIVENSEDSNDKLREIKNILKDDNLERPGKKLNTDFSGSEASSTHKWKCMKCGQRISSLPCPYCSDK